MLTKNESNKDNQGERVFFYQDPDPRIHTYGFRILLFSAVTFKMLTKSTVSFFLPFFPFYLFTGSTFTSVSNDNNVLRIFFLLVDERSQIRILTINYGSGSERPKNLCLQIRNTGFCTHFLHSCFCAHLCALNFLRSAVCAQLSAVSFLPSPFRAHLSDFFF